MRSQGFAEWCRANAAEIENRHDAAKTESAAAAERLNHLMHESTVAYNEAVELQKKQSQAEIDLSYTEKAREIALAGAEKQEQQLTSLQGQLDAINAKASQGEAEELRVLKETEAATTARLEVEEKIELCKQ